MCQTITLCFVIYKIFSKRYWCAPLLLTASPNPDKNVPCSADARHATHCLFQVRANRTLGALRVHHECYGIALE